MSKNQITANVLGFCVIIFIMLILAVSLIIDVVINNPGSDPGGVGIIAIIFCALVIVFSGVAISKILSDGNSKNDS